ncbi:MAG TPA: hypothetical protein VMH26_04740 [Burkholderiales bacterium]|nr:hypothetical protein [Burkholderiales bacterium]
MIITQAVREAGTEREVYLLLTAYVKATRLGGQLKSPPTELTRLPLTGRDDVRARTEALFAELGLASRGLDDDSRVVIKEALYVFGEALFRLKSLDGSQRPSGVSSQSDDGAGRVPRDPALAWEGAPVDSHAGRLDVAIDTLGRSHESV